MGLGKAAAEWCVGYWRSKSGRGTLWQQWNGIVGIVEGGMAKLGLAVWVGFVSERWATDGMGMYWQSGIVSEWCVQVSFCGFRFGLEGQSWIGMSVLGGLLFGGLRQLGIGMARTGKSLWVQA